MAGVVGQALLHAPELPAGRDGAFDILITFVQRRLDPYRQHVVARGQRVTGTFGQPVRRRTLQERLGQVPPSSRSSSWIACRSSR